MKKKIIVIIVVLILLIGLGVFIFLGVNRYKQDKKLAADNMAVIEKNYKELQNNVANYNQYRNDFGELVKDIYLDSFKEKNDSYLELLNKYNDTMEKIDKNIANIKDKCNRLYTDSEINKICNNYEKTYEKLVNIFIADVNKYNEKVNEYNEYKNEEVSLFTIDYVDYMDYNHDGVYDGKENSEKDLEEKDEGRDSSEESKEESQS